MFLGEKAGVAEAERVGVVGAENVGVVRALLWFWLICLMRLMTIGVVKAGEVLVSYIIHNTVRLTVQFTLASFLP